MIVGSLLACSGFAGYSFLRLVAKQNEQQVDDQSAGYDVERGFDAKKKLLDHLPKNESVRTPSLPRKC